MTEESLNEFVARPQAQELGTYITIKELSTLLRISVGSLRKYARAGKLPFVKVGKMIRFNRMRIEEWLNNGSSSFSEPIVPTPAPAEVPSDQKPIKRRRSIRVRSGQLLIEKKLGRSPVYGPQKRFLRPCVTFPPLLP
jgi:excisionase family DNA binding protein